MPKNAEGGYDINHQPNWSDPVEVEQYKYFLSQQNPNAPASYSNVGKNPIHNMANQHGLEINSDDFRRLNSIELGRVIGQQEFYDDPDMKRLRELREQYAQGYDSQELGAIRQTARGEIAGAQAAQQRKLQSGLGRGGVGGARAAAVVNTAGQQGMKATADAERKMALDSAQMKRQGVGDLQDFMFRQKYGKLGTGIGMASLGSADYAAQQAAVANQQGGGSPNPLQQLQEGIDTLTWGSGGIPFAGIPKKFGFKF